MNNQDHTKYVRENYKEMTDREIGRTLGISQHAVRRIRLKNDWDKPQQGIRGKSPPDKLTKLQQLLEKNDIDVEEIGSLKQVKLNEWQGYIKNAEGDPELVDLEGISVVLTPSWAEGPKWPAVQPATPANITPVKVSKAKRKYKVAVVLPDPQIGFRRDVETLELDPFHDETAMNIALQIIRELNPDIIVNLGDILDFPMFSTFEQESTFQFTVQATVDRAHEFLAEQIANGPNAQVVLIEGNHDRRLQKALARNFAEASGLKRAQMPEEWPVLSVPSLLQLDELGVKYVEGYPAGTYWINERLQCIHGRIVRSNASTAKAVSLNERVSTIFGHIHRIESQYKTVRTYKGARTNLAATPGCLCHTDGRVPSTKGSTDVMGRPIPSPEDWQQGLMVVSYLDGDAPFAVEQVYIHEGWAMFRGQEFTTNTSETR